MATMLVEVPSEIEEFVRSVAVARGESERDVVRTILIDARDRLESLRRDVREGLDCLDRGKASPAADVFERLARRAPRMGRRLSAGGEAESDRT